MYSAYFYKGKTMLLERYLVLHDEYCEENNYDIFDLTLHPKVVEKSQNLKVENYQLFSLLNYQSHELFSSFSEYEDPENKKVYLCTQVHSATKTKIIINSMCGGLGKLFLNGKCLSIHPYKGTSQYYVTGCLEKGLNTIILEMYSPTKSTVFSIQIRNYKFEMSNAFEALSNLGNNIQIDPFVLISDPTYIPTNNAFKFMYFKNNKEKFNERYIIDIYDTSTGIVKLSEGTLNKSIEINVKEWRDLHSETLRQEWITCRFTCKDGTERVTAFGLFLNDFGNRRSEIANRALLYAKQLDDEIHCALTGRLAQMALCEKNKDFQSLISHTWHLKETLSSIESGRYPYHFYKTISGVHEFNIHSKLDDSVIRMMAKLPREYDMDRAYPVILALSAIHGYFCCGAIEDIVEEPCLYFDVTGRGFNGGSYIGEASIVDILKWIKENYKVDEDRVYLLGYSNGGYATYSIAQNHPHLPAAIFPLTGNPMIETIKNISNIPTYQMVSSKDYAFIGGENKVNNMIGGYGNYHQYNFKEMIHHDFSEYLYHKRVLNDMLKHRRNPYPDEIIYKTCRNRHLKSFWIKINGIAKGYKYAQIKANIEHTKLIQITATGTNSITVRIPPQIHKDGFTFILNKKVFSLENFTENEITFTKQREWGISDNTPDIDFRKGTGLLDIYLSSLKIIIPQNQSEGIIRQTAENFSKPCSNGYDPVMYTNYPIYEDGKVPGHIFGNNLILLDFNKTNSYVHALKDKLIVEYDDFGYVYKGKRIESDYVIMQVIANPYNPNLSVLINSTNNTKLLSKNLFTRKVILPYYSNGIHPCWNNEVLIFTGNTYYTVYEKGEDIS